MEKVYEDLENAWIVRSVSLTLSVVDPFFQNIHLRIFDIEYISSNLYFPEMKENEVRNSYMLDTIFYNVG